MKLLQLTKSGINNVLNDHRHRLILFTSVAVLFVSCLSKTVSSDVTLVKDGIPQSILVIPRNSNAEEGLAAERFQWYIQKITGVQLDIVSEADESIRTNVKNKIYIGNTNGSRKYLDELKQRKEPAEASLVVTQDDDHVYIIGVDPIGTLHAVYFLLEDLGCRWYFPARWGTVIPESSSLSIAKQKKFRAPDFKLRSGLYHTTTKIDQDPSWAVWEWGRGNHLGGWNSWGSGHSYRFLIPKDKFKEHPEWFALVNGKRTPDQLCLTNPDGRTFALNVVKKKLENNPTDLVWISPNDTKAYRFCQCKACSKYVPDLSNGSGKNYTEGDDRIIAYANFFADALREDYPDTRFVYYVDYHSHGFPGIVNPAPNSAFWIVHWNDDQFHGQSDRSNIGKSLSAWGKFKHPLLVRPYWGSHTSWAFWPVVHALQNDVRYYHSKGVVGIYSETHRNWGTEHLNFIVFPRLLWDKDTNVNELVDEFCRLFYGPAAKPMRRFYAIMEQAAEDGPEQRRYRQWLIPVFTPQVLTRMRQCIREAETAIEGHNNIFRQRLDFVKAGFKIADFYYSAEHLMRTYPETKDQKIRNRVVQLLRRSVAVIDDPQFHDRLNPKSSRLIESTPINLPNQLRMLLAQHEQGTTFEAGDFKYFEDYYLGGRTFLDAKQKTGFTDGRYGLVLDTKKKGALLYHFDTKQGKFEKVSGALVLGNSTSDVPVTIQIKTAPNQTWNTVLEHTHATMSRIGQAAQGKIQFDLTHYVQGHNQFRLLIEMQNQTSTNRHVLHQLHLNGLVLEKANQ